MNGINGNVFRGVIAGAIVGALFLGVACPSRADDGGDAPKVTVKFGDLNVSSPEGAAALYGRIRAAAKSVCGRQDFGFLASTASYDACIRKSVADAVMKVNQPALFIVYNDHNKTPLPTTLLSQSR